MLESGSRFRDEDFAGSTWDARRYFFAPRLGLRGIMRMTLFPDVLIVSGAGVGGGSLGYANTLYRAHDAFFEAPRWRDLADWKADLAAHYDTARKGPKEDKGPPRWQQALSKGSARTTFVVGALLTLPGGSYLAGL